MYTKNARKRYVNQANQPFDWLVKKDYREEHLGEQWGQENRPLVPTALLILGTGGTAAPVVVGAVAVAYTLGGLGNIYTTYATSNGDASGTDLLGSFIIGGTFNTLSLATGLGAMSNTIDGLFVNGMADLGDNIAVGVSIGISTNIATSIGTLDSPFAVKRDFKRRAVL